MKIEDFYCMNYPFLSKKKNVRFDFCLETGSTNSDLKKWVRENYSDHSRCLVAVRQVSGRGTRGKSWTSECGGIFFSLTVPVESIVCSKALIPLAVGVGVCKLFKENSEIALLKWPNDIWISNGKAGGILCELVRDCDGQEVVVIGVGLNQKCQKKTTTKGWNITGIETTDFKIDNPEKRTRFLDGVLVKILEELQFNDDAIVKEWGLYDSFNGASIVLEADEEDVTGVSKGIDNHGRLLIETSIGVRAFSTGSIKKNDNAIN